MVTYIPRSLYAFEVITTVTRVFWSAIGVKGKMLKKTPDHIFFQKIKELALEIYLVTIAIGPAIVS